MKNIISVDLVDGNKEVGNFRTVVRGNSEEIACALACVLLNLMDNKQFDIIRNSLNYISHEMGSIEDVA